MQPLLLAFEINTSTLNLIPSLPVIAGAMVAFGVLWKFGRKVYRIDKSLPVLLTIADQFQPNGGNSLRDQIDKINTKLDNQLTATNKRHDELEVADKFAIKIAEDSRLIAETNAAIVKEIAVTQADDIAHIKEYMHDRWHRLSNDIIGFQLHALQADDRSKRIEERLDRIIPLIARHREDYEGPDADN